MKKITYSLKEIKKINLEFIELLKNYSIFLFFGEMGAGKTTLIKNIIKDLFDCGELINSPTYSYMNQYFCKKLNKNIYHFDLYRLKKISEIDELGLKEFLVDENAIIFIEWPELILNSEIFKNKKYCICELNYEKIRKRKIAIEIR